MPSRVDILAIIDSLLHEQNDMRAALILGLLFGKVLVIALHARDVPRRYPLGRRPRLDLGLAVHEVDVLKTETDGFVQEEVHNQTGGDVGGYKDKAVCVGYAVCSQRREEGNHDCGRCVGRG